MHRILFWEFVPLSYGIVNYSTDYNYVAHIYLASCPTYFDQFQEH